MRACIEKYLPKLTGDDREKWQAEIRNLDAEIKRIQRDLRFQEAKAKLVEILDDPKRSACDKRDALKKFFVDYGEYETDYRSDFTDLKKRHETLGRFAKWEMTLERIKALCKLKFDAASDDRLPGHKRECEELLASLSEFNEIALTIQVEEAEAQLKSHIKYIDSIMHGVTYRDVQDAEDAYTRSPTQVNIDLLNGKIKGFRNGSDDDVKRHKALVDAIERRCNLDWNSRKRIKETWEALKKNPCIKTWEEFKNAWEVAMGAGQVSRIFVKPEELDPYGRYYKYMMTAQSIRVELLSAVNLWKAGDYRGDRRFRIEYRTDRVKGGWDLWVDIKVGSKVEKEYYIGNIGKDTKLIAGRLDYRITTDCQTQQLFRLYTIGNSWVVKASSYSDNADEFRIDPIKILVRFAQGEEFVEETYEGPKGVIIKLRFSR